MKRLPRRTLALLGALALVLGAASAAAASPEQAAFQTPSSTGSFRTA
jgi:hypothetical protein